MSKEQFQTRLDSDMAERVEKYRDEHELTSAEAVRRLVAAGIEDESEPTREQIAADLDNLRDELVESENDEDEVQDEGPLRKAGQTAVLISILVIGLLSLLLQLIIFGGGI